MSYSGQARGFRAYAWLGVGALGVGVWASLAGAGIAAADNQSSRASGAAVSATPTTSAKTTKSTRPTTRGARARAAARGLIDQGAISQFDPTGAISLADLSSQVTLAYAPISEEEGLPNTSGPAPTEDWKVVTISPRVVGLEPQRLEPRDALF